jgi:hypothetical protein
MKNVGSRLPVRGFTILLVAATLIQPLSTRTSTAENRPSEVASLDTVRAKAVKFLKLTQSEDGTWQTFQASRLCA